MQSLRALLVTANVQNLCAYKTGLYYGRIVFEALHATHASERQEERALLTTHMTDSLRVCAGLAVLCLGVVKCRLASLALLLIWLETVETADNKAVSLWEEVNKAS